MFFVKKTVQLLLRIYTVGASEILTPLKIRKLIKYPQAPSTILCIFEYRDTIPLIIKKFHVSGRESLFTLFVGQ